MLYITYTLLFSPLPGWSLSLPTSFAWKPPMTSGTVNTARRARPSQRCRTVRTCDKHSQRVAATHSLLTFPFFSCTGTLVVWRANCCANMPPHQRSFGFFNSEYFTSTLRVVCSQAVPAPDCLTYISLSTAVLVVFVILFIYLFFVSYPLQLQTKPRRSCPLHLTPPPRCWSAGRYAATRMLLWLWGWTMKVAVIDQR